MSEPTKEYLFAKAELCTKLAKQQEERDEIAEALRNMERANRAMARIFNLDDEGVGTCHKCNSWCDSLEAGVCQTCINEKEDDNE